MIRELNLNNYIRYFNDLRDDILPLFYNAADVFVFPSLYEGFGLPILEAMACNVPVIAADATCFPEILGEAGMLFNPMDIKELSEALTKVLEDKNLTDDLVKKGQERVRNFRWRNTAEQTLKLYREVYE